MVDVTCNPAEKLLSPNTLVQDRSVEEAEKGFKGKLCLQWGLHVCAVYVQKWTPLTYELIHNFDLTRLVWDLLSR